MEQSQKKPYKSFYSKSKPYGSSNYEYNSYGHSYYNDGYYKSNNSYKYSKPRKYYNDSNSYQPVHDHNPPSTTQDTFPDDQYKRQDKTQGHQGKWLHDKFAENEEKLASESAQRSVNKPEQRPKPKPKAEKRPDRQLYSARNKHTHADDANTEEASTVNNIGHGYTKENVTNESVTSNNDSRISQDHAEKFPEQKEDPSSQGSLKKIHSDDKEKEIHPCEEDKSFLSNVSTAMSEKPKNGEEESIPKEKAGTVEALSSLKELDQKVVFCAYLEMETNVEKILFYEDTDDYENLLDQACKVSNIQKRMGLYLKINLLKILFDKHPNKTRVGPILDKYIDINSKLVLYENGFDALDDSIKEYIHDDDRNQF